MIGFILAAGFGTRLRPLTDHIPKALVPVAGTPLLGHALRFLSTNGIMEIGVNTHYLPEMIESYREKSTIPFRIFNETGAIRGTGGAFHFARDFLAKDETFFMINVDILAHYSFKNALEYFRKSDAYCMLLAFPAKGKGTIYYDNTSHLYRGTTEYAEMPSGMTSTDFIGAAMYKREYLDYITPDDFSIVPTWSRAVSDGKRVIVYVIDHGFWRDIGTPQALLGVHCDIIDKKIELDLPEHCSIDHERKVCHPKTVRISNTMGAYSWIESEVLPEGTKTGRVVIFPNVSYTGAKEMTNSIVTVWGSLPVHE